MENLQGLWAFVQVARCGSFTGAAEYMGISTAAMSKSIARLETKLDTRLFNRTTRRIHLTGEGQTLFDALSSSFGNIETALDTVQHVRQDPVGVIRLSTVTAFGKHSLLPVLAEFMGNHPKVSFAISFHDTARGLSRQGYDIRVNWASEPREKDKVSQILCQTPLVCVASPGYLAQLGTPRNPEDLKHHQCINVCLVSGEVPRWEFARKSLRSKGGARPYRHNPKGRVIVLDELDAVVDAALLGLGITVIAEHNVSALLQEGKLELVLPEFSVAGPGAHSTDIVIQYPQRKHLPLKLKVLVDFLLERFRNGG